MNSTMLTAHLHEITAGLEASLNNATLAQTITASLSASEVSSLMPHSSRRRPTHHHHHSRSPSL
jgi:hypothetical protein